MESKSQKLRLDQLIVQQGLAPTRSKAQELIEEGDVEILNQGIWKPAKASSQPMNVRDEIRLIDPKVLKYVSRGGRKLEGALLDFGIDVTGLAVLDVGQSTGGFTDCLLQAGAHRVVGVDVGHDQLHSKLRADPRVTFFEGLHLQELSNSPTFKAATSDGIHLIVVDLSFISTLAVLEQVLQWADEAVLLIKPQFETQWLASADATRGKKQMVFEEKMFEDLKVQVLQKLQVLGWQLCSVSLSRIRGKDGNQEFFVHAHKS